MVKYERDYYKRLRTKMLGGLSRLEAHQHIFDAQQRCCIFTEVLDYAEKCLPPTLTKAEISTIDKRKRNQKDY